MLPTTPTLEGGARENATRNDIEIYVFKLGHSLYFSVDKSHHFKGCLTIGKTNPESYNAGKEEP